MSLICHFQYIAQYSHLSTHRVTLMLISYRRYRGIVTRMRVIRSGGVMMAATSIMIRNECFRYFEINKTYTITTTCTEYFFSFSYNAGETKRNSEFLT